MSLVTTPARDLSTCERCVSTSVTRITMTLTDGSVVDFASCHRCEHRTWRQAGTPLSREIVLAKAKKHKVAA